MMRVGLVVRQHEPAKAVGRQPLDHLDEEPAKATALLPVKVSNGGKRLVITGKNTKVDAAMRVGAIHVDFGYARVRIEGKADPECVRAAIEGLRR